MPFWHDLITERSLQVLQGLRRDYRFILIGGWAVYLYCRTLKSKDIDLVIEPDELYRLREKFEVLKNDRLKKYEARQGEVDIDLYVPYYSNPGIPAEEIRGETTQREGFEVPTVSLLLLLKLNAYQARRGSLKGEKDELDLISLLMSEEMEWKSWKKVADRYDRHDLDLLLREVVRRRREVPELGISQHHWAKVRKKIPA